MTWESAAGVGHGVLLRDALAVKWHICAGCLLFGCSVRCWPSDVDESTLASAPKRSRLFLLCSSVGRISWFWVDDDTSSAICVCLRSDYCSRAHGSRGSSGAGLDFLFFFFGSRPRADVTFGNIWCSEVCCYTFALNRWYFFSDHLAVHSSVCLSTGGCILTRPILCIRRLSGFAWIVYPIRGRRSSVCAQRKASRALRSGPSADFFCAL